MPLPAVQSSVDPVDQPSEQTLVRGFGQGLNGKVSLGETGSHCQVQTITKQEEGGEEEKPLNPHLFLGLSLLNVLSSHFDPGGQDGPGELQHVDAQQVAQFLSSRVVGHGRLVVVLLLHEGDVAELEHGGDDLEHGCGGEMVTTLILQRHEKTRAGASLALWSSPLHSFSSGLKPIIPMESMVWVKFSESLWPGTGMDPPLRKRYWSAVPKSSSARNPNKIGDSEKLQHYFTRTL